MLPLLRLLLLLLSLLVHSATLRRIQTSRYRSCFVLAQRVHVCTPYMQVNPSYPIIAYPRRLSFACAPCEFEKTLQLCMVFNSLGFPIVRASTTLAPRFVGRLRLVAQCVLRACWQPCWQQAHEKRNAIDVGSKPLMNVRKLCTRIKEARAQLRQPSLRPPENSCESIHAKDASGTLQADPQ